MQILLAAIHILVYYAFYFLIVHETYFTSILGHSSVFFLALLFISSHTHTYNTCWPLVEFHNLEL